jgi:O-antigen ligase
MVNSGPLLTKSLSAWLFKWGEGVLLFYFGQVFLDKKKVKILLLIFLLSGFLISIDGIYQKIFGIDFIRGFSLMEASGFKAITAAFRHYNNFSTYVTVMFLIAIGFLIHQKKVFLRILLSLLSLLLLVDLFFTFSRGAWLALIIACLILRSFSSSRRVKKISFIMLVVFLAGLIFLPTVGERFITIFKKGGDADRFIMWKVAFLMFRESPILGKGIGLFMDHMNNYQYKGLDGLKFQYSQYAHNCYFQILAETGLAGLISFLWFLAELMFRGYRRLKQKVDFMFIGLFCAITAFLVHSFFDTQFYSLKLSVLFWVMASFLAVYICSDSSDDRLEDFNKRT